MSMESNMDGLLCAHFWYSMQTKCNVGNPHLTCATIWLANDMCWFRWNVTVFREREQRNVAQHCQCDYLPSEQRAGSHSELGAVDRWQAEKRTKCRIASNENVKKSSFSFNVCIWCRRVTLAHVCYGVWVKRWINTNSLTDRMHNHVLWICKSVGLRAVFSNQEWEQTQVNSVTSGVTSKYLQWEKNAPCFLVAPSVSSSPPRTSLFLFIFSAADA